MEGNHFPFEFKDFDPEQSQEIINNFKGFTDGCVKVGPQGFVMPARYKEVASMIYNLTVQPSDIFVITFPRSGTTWTQELVWLLANDLDYQTAAMVPLLARYRYLEMVTLFSHSMEKKNLKEHKTEETKEVLKVLTANPREALAAMGGRRFVKSHLPLSLLPPALLDTAKVVCVARDPRDCAVSFYHFNRLFKAVDYVGDFKTYWKMFMNNQIIYTPFFEIYKEAWAKRDHPNILFLFYDDIVKDLRSAVLRVSAFLGKQLSEAQTQRLCDHLRFDNFKNNKSVNMAAMDDSSSNAGEKGFIRKGKAGGWREYFDDEMRAQAERWIAQNLAGTDLRFPEQEQ